MSPVQVTVGPGWTDRVAARVATSPAGPAGNRLVAVDGFSGSGKSTLARELAGRLGAALLELEDLYPGWHGLPDAPGLARRGIGDPLAAGRALRWTSWNWAGDRPGPERERPPAAVVVLEGCGAGSLALAPVTALSIWVDAPPEVRDARLRAREDWPVHRPFRAMWRTAEETLAASDRTPQRADILLRNG